MMGAYPRSVYASGMNKANFSRMDQSTAEDWQVIMTEQKGFMKGLPDKILAHMELLGGDYGGFPIDRLQHSLQTAHLAAEAGEDEEFIVCALLHDIGDTLGPVNHADVAAVILEPFVSEANHWMVKHHAIFQGYHFFHHLGLDLRVGRVTLHRGGATTGGRQHRAQHCGYETRRHRCSPPLRRRLDVGRRSETVGTNLWRGLLEAC